MVDFRYDSKFKFQSTLPLRGATRCVHDTNLNRYVFQSTLPLRGATLTRWGLRYWFAFQSTLPLRGATRPWSRRRSNGQISIHAPLAGSDDHSA